MLAAATKTVTGKNEAKTKRKLKNKQIEKTRHVLSCCLRAAVTCVNSLLPPAAMHARMHCCIVSTCTSEDVACGCQSRGDRRLHMPGLAAIEHVAPQQPRGHMVVTHSNGCIAMCVSFVGGVLGPPFDHVGRRDAFYNTPRDYVSKVNCTHVHVLSLPRGCFVVFRLPVTTHSTAAIMESKRAKTNNNEDSGKSSTFHPLIST